MLRRPPAWAADYVGLPFVARGSARDGVDCWGLVRLVYAERYGIDLPAHTDAYEDPHDSAVCAAAIASRRSGWRRLAAAELPREGDVALLKVSGRACHVGLACGDWLLHARDGVGVVVERVDGWLLRHALDSWWRHPLMEARQ